MRRVLSLLLLLAALPASAERLDIDTIFGDVALSGPAPRKLAIAPDGRRVGFLRGRADDRYQLDLWEYNLADNRTRLLVDSRQLAPQEQVSDEEKARRERQRTADYKGIVDYRWSPDGRRLLFPLGDALYLYELDAAPEQAVRKLQPGKGVVTDAQISPLGHYVSYVRDQNLYVIDLRSGRETALTTDGKGPIHNGEAEFVAQEEMDQTSGYWWAGDDSAIAYKRYDESKVPLVRRFEIQAERTDVVEQRYPAAGAANVEVKLGVVTPRGGPTRWIDLGRERDIYLARVDWLPTHDAIAFQRESRDQKHLDLMLADLRTGKKRLLLSEASRTWLNLHEDLHFLKREAAFVWASERSGWKQLYLYGLDGQLRRRLTDGDWPIDRLGAVDESTGQLWFTSNKDDAAGRQLYRVSLDGHDAAQPQRVTQGEGLHDIVLPKGADQTGVQLYVDTYADPRTPPQTAVHAIEGERLASIEANTLDDTHPYARYRDQHVVPEFGRVPADDGTPLPYSLLKPPGFDARKRYPVLLIVYGGPTAQKVVRGWPELYDEYMAQQGYLVLRVDNRGAERYGRAFSDVIAGRLGDVEVRDQLAALRWLAQQPYVDAKRIGVFGWSYGGYMTLMLLAKGSDLISAGAAVAPVTDWRIYDTHYTERYLGKPQDNPDGYRDSAVFGVLAGLKSPLLLVHGMADDNVLFSNSTQLMAALQNQGTPFSLMTYPGGKHGLSTPAMKRHAYHAITDFFAAKLAAPSTEGAKK